MFRLDNISRNARNSFCDQIVLVSRYLAMVNVDLAFFFAGLRNHGTFGA